MFMWSTISPKKMWFGFKYDEKYAAYFEITYSYPDVSYIKFHNIYNNNHQERTI